MMDRRIELAICFGGLATMNVKVRVFFSFSVLQQDCGTVYLGFRIFQLIMFDLGFVFKKPSL